MRWLWCVLLITLSQLHQPVVWSAALCQSDTVSCVTEQLLHLTQTHPMVIAEWSVALWQAAQRHTLPVDPRSLLPTMHTAGMQLAQQPASLEEYAHWCGQLWRGACWHGVLMEQLDEGVVINCAIVGDWEYINCVHAQGHIFTAHSTGDLLSTLQQCDEYTDYAHDACASGVFMEWSAAGQSGLGHHSETPAGTYTVPCATLPPQWQSICSASNGGYRQYVSGRESFQATQQFCETQPDITACQHGMNIYQALSLGL